MGWIINQTNPTATNRQLVGAVLSTQDQEIVQVPQKIDHSVQSPTLRRPVDNRSKEQRDSSTLRWMWP